MGSRKDKWALVILSFLSREVSVQMCPSETSERSLTCADPVRGEERRRLGGAHKKALCVSAIVW